MLREQGAIPPQKSQKERPLSPQERLLKSYECYLLEDRGLTRATAANNVPFADQFLCALSAKFRRPRLTLSQLRAADVTDFVQRQTPKLSPGRAQLLVTALRSFLRYLLRHRPVDLRRRRLCNALGRVSVGQSAFDDPTKQVKSVAGAPVNAGGRSVVKGGLTLSIMALWQIELLEDQEKNMAGSSPVVPAI
jgi:hypothetical protein